MMPKRDRRLSGRSLALYIDSVAFQQWEDHTDVGGCGLLKEDVGHWLQFLFVSFDKVQIP